MSSSDEIQEKPPRAERLNGYVIRSSTPDDAVSITALANLPGYRYGTLRLPFQTVAETRQYLENPAPGAKKLVADLDGVIIGGIFLFGDRVSAVQAGFMTLTVIGVVGT